MILNQLSDMKYKYIILVFISMLSISCGINRKIIGVYADTLFPLNNTIEFKKNGTFIQKTQSMHCKRSYNTGTYKVEGNHIELLPISQVLDLMGKKDFFIGFSDSLVNDKRIYIYYNENYLSDSNEIVINESDTILVKNGYISLPEKYKDGDLISMVQRYDLSRKIKFYFESNNNIYIWGSYGYNIFNNYCNDYFVRTYTFKNGMLEGEFYSTKNKLQLKKLENK
jgi:hypothetical protein